MGACTAEQHVYAGWILGTPCQCGATVVALQPDGHVRATAVLRATPGPVAAAPDTLAVEFAADAAQAESEADQEAEDALGPRRGRKR